MKKVTFAEIIAAILSVLKDTASGLRSVVKDIDIILEASQKIKESLQNEGVEVLDPTDRSLDADQVAELALKRLKESVV